MSGSHDDGETALKVLKSLCLSGGKEGLSEQSSIIESEDGSNNYKLKLMDQELDMKQMLELSIVKKNNDPQILTYSLGSIYFQIRDPDQSLLKYRQECKKFGIDDQVKVLHKVKLLEYFYGQSNDKDGNDDQHHDDHDDMEESDKETNHIMDNKNDKPSSQPPTASVRKVVTMGIDNDNNNKSNDRSSKSSSYHRDKHHHHRHNKKDRHKQSSTTKDKKSKGPITNEDLFANLETVVGKRSDPTKDSTTTTTVSTTTTTTRTKEADTETVSAEAVETSKQQQEVLSVSKSTGGGDGLLLDQQQKKQNLEAQRIKACLSSVGFEVNNSQSKELLEQDRAAVEKITAGEIPVGNSASILRPTNHKRDFLRVLELYQQVLKQESNNTSNSNKSSKHHPNDSKRPKTSSQYNKHNRIHNNNGKNHNKRRETLGKPIIVVPNAMTSPITLINAEEFFVRGKYITRNDMLKRGGIHAVKKRSSSITMQRNISSRLGGGLMEYEIIDNPVTRLASSKDWDRIVAVIAQGAAWQFKGWKYNNPVDIFSKMFGFFIGMEGTPLPKDISTWNVKKEVFSRDKRGIDQITFASFWNSLDEWMSVHKPEYLPSEEV